MLNYVETSKFPQTFAEASDRMIWHIHSPSQTVAQLMNSKFHLAINMYPAILKNWWPAMHKLIR